MNELEKDLLKDLEKRRKYDLNVYMEQLAQWGFSDNEVLYRIREYAIWQLIKSPQGFEDFCVDCGIQYTKIVLEKYNLRLSKDKKWQLDFIEKCEYANIMFLDKTQTS